MTAQRERFESWWPTVGQTVGEVAAWLAWQEAERQAIERCAKVCKALSQGFHPDDLLYGSQEDATFSGRRDGSDACFDAINALGDDDAAK